MPSHPITAVPLLLGCLGAATAADVGGGLQLGGYVDTILTIADGDEAIQDPADDSAIIDFTAAAQLDVDYQIDDTVEARMELYWDADADGADLEEAHIVWALSDQVSLIMGKFENWVGWEGADAPELYRINGAYATSGGTVTDSGDPIGIFGENTTGLGAIISAADNVEIGLFIVDFIYGEPDDRPNDSVSFGGYVDYIAEGIGEFQFDLMYGVNEVANEEDILGLDLWAEIDALSEDQGLTFAVDVNYTDYESDSSLVLLGMVNYALKTDIPMSMTLMIDYIDPFQDDTGPLGADDDGLEAAVALLTNPTKDENFALNFEGRYISRALDDADEFGLFAEMLAIIP